MKNGRLGSAGHAVARRGVAGRGKAGKAGHGLAGPGEARQDGAAGEAWPG